MYTVYLLIFCTGLHNSIGTFAVQSVEIGTRNDREGYVDITCHFAQGSETKGCRIIIAQVEQEYELCTLAVPIAEENADATVTIGLPKGSYTVLVYDIDDNEIVENPAFSGTLTVTSSSQEQTGGIL